MSLLKKLSRVMRVAASMVAPLCCVVCGGPVAQEACWPLCGGCQRAILDEAAAGAIDTRCSVCGKPIISERGRCMRCRTSDLVFDSAYPVLRYADDVRAVVLAYKSGRRRSLAGFFADILAEAAYARFPGRTLVPVPPRPGKLRRKGWDQVEDIVRILERRHGFSVARVLSRTDGGEQKTLDIAGRAANMQGRIRVERGAAVPVAIVLIDDVLTTGATLSACASALKASGSMRVDALTIAAD